MAQGKLKSADTNAKTGTGDVFVFQNAPTFTGIVTGIDKTMVGLSNVDNTSDSNKPVSTAQQTALNGKANTSHTHTASQVTDFNSASDARIANAAGVSIATLSGGKIPTSQLPPLALTDVFTVVSQVAQLALTAEEGDVAIRTDQNKSYIHNGGVAGTMADWSELLTPTDTVLSVNGEVGAVTLTTDDILDTGQTNKWATETEKTKLGFLAVTQSVDLDVIEINANNVPAIKTKTDNITVTQAVNLDTIETNSDASKVKTDFITITQAVNLDTIESDTVLNNAKVSNATHTGDATGDTALTLATVNTNLGSFGLAGSIAQFVVNAKGLITSAVNIAISITASQVSDFANTVRATVLTGISFITSTAVSATDSILVAIGKLQAQNTAQDTTISNKVTSNTAITANTAIKITYDAKGLVTNGATLLATDIPNISQSQVTNLATDLTDKQNTISLTTTGTSGPSTLIGATLNIPNYAGGGVIPTGTGFTHITAGVQDVASKLVDTADINNSQITNGKLSQMPNNTFKGNNTGVLANPVDLTTNQATALLDSMTGASGIANGAKGLVPQPLIINQLQFLRGDGTWASPAGAGGSSPSGLDTEVQVNNAGAFGAFPGFKWIDATKTLLIGGVNTGIELMAITAEPTTPATGLGRLYAKAIATRVMPKWVGPSGVDYPIQSHLAFNNVRMWRGGNTAVATTFASTTGTMPYTGASPVAPTIPALAVTDILTQTVRSLISTAATAGSLAYIRANQLNFWRGNLAGRGGFFVVHRFALSGTLQAGLRAFAGITDSVANPTNIDPLTSTTPGCVGLAVNANTGNWRLVNNITGTARTALDLGATFPVTGAGMMELVLYSKPNDTGISYRVTNLSTGATTTGTLTTNIPANTTFLNPVVWITNNATAAAQTLNFISTYVETDY